MPKFKKIKCDILRNFHTVCTYFLTVYEPPQKRKYITVSAAQIFLLKQIASLFSTLKQFPFIATGTFYFPSDYIL